MRRSPTVFSWTRASLFAAVLLCASSELARAQEGQGGANGDAVQPPGAQPAPASDNALQAPGSELAGERELSGPRELEGELDDERARAHFSAGEAYFVVERYADAAREFALAYELSRRPEMLVNLSRAHERGGELHGAVADLELLLELYPATSYRGEAYERIAAMRSRMVAPPRAVAPTSAFAGGASNQATELPRFSWPSWPALSLAAGAGAAVVVAIGTGVRAHRIYKQLEGRCPDQTCLAPFEGERQHGRRLARTSTGFTFAAVALASAATVLWLYEARKHKRRLAVGVKFDGVGSEAHLRAQF